MDVATVLRSIPGLVEVDDASIETLATTFQIQDVGDRHVFISEGELGDFAFLVLEGEIVVSSEGSGTRRELRRMGPGELFGLIALVDDEPRSATCTAAGPVQVASLSRAAFNDLISQNAPLSLAFLRALGAQLARDFRNIAGQVRQLLEASPADDPGGGGETDVVVMGGGPIGLIYATWVKRFRPDARVVVIERKARPGHKIGESTLATTTRCMRAMGLSLTILRRLFANKAGLRFFHTEPDSDKLNRHFDIVDIEETYQVERRVLEMALQETTKREGVELRTGTRIDIKQSKLDGDRKEIACTGPDGVPYTLGCKVLCDASGPASVLPHHLGLYRKDLEAVDTFNCNSYFGYFRPRQDVPVDQWTYPATRHICFPGGWMWFITLNSWESTPDDRLQGMIEELLDHPPGPDQSYPSRQELAERHGCSSEPVISIGYTIRQDRDDSTGLPMHERFDHITDKHPAIRWVMDHYELIGGHYANKQRAYSAFMNMAHDCEQVTGDGWCVVGDAAMFTNPLFSHGLNFGTGTAYMAARDTAQALSSGDLSQRSFATYERYAHDIFRQNMNETDMLIRSFDHIDSYERTLALKVFFAVSDVLARDEYSETDPFVFDLLNPAWIAQVDKVADAQRAGERAGLAPAEIARQVRQLIDSFVDPILARPEVRELALGRYMSYYDDAGRRTEDKGDKPRGDFRAVPCQPCNLYFDDSLDSCPYCGRPAEVAQGKVARAGVR